MIFYISIFILLLLPIIFDNGRITKRNGIIYYLILPLFLCFGYMTGSDWRNYEIDFNFIDSFNDVQENDREKGYYLLGYLFKLIGFNFWNYAITIKLIGYYIFLSFYKRYSEGNVFGLIFFFVNFALFLWIDHPARNFCAIIIYLYSFKYIYERKIFKYILICLLASFFHLSALFLIPVYFFNRSYNKNLYLILVALSIVFFIVSNTFLPYLNILIDSSFFYSRFKAYLNELYIGQTMNVFRFIFNVLIVLLAIIKQKEIEKYKYGSLMLNLSVIYLLIFSLGNINIILFRFNFYYVLPFVALISYLFCIFNSLSYKVYKYSIILISFMYLFILITKDSRYIPYTNYISFTFKEKPSYYYRINYNSNNSPYAK